MSHIHARRLAASATAVALATAAVVTAAPAPAAPRAAARVTSQTATAPTVHIAVGAASYVRMRTHLHPGTQRFVVTAGGRAALQLVRPRAGYTRAELARDANRGLAHGKVPALRRFERNTELIGGVEARPGHPGIFWLHLRRGTYYALDTNPTALLARKIRTIHVTGSLRTTRPPRPTAVIRAVHEHTWARLPRTIPRSGVLAWRNRATDNHFIAMARLLPGKTIADWKTWVDKAAAGQDPGPEPVDESVGFDTAVVAPGHGMSQRYSAPAGNYVLVCFWPDADMGGAPHAFMGMWRAIHLR